MQAPCSVRGAIQRDDLKAGGISEPANLSGDMRQRAGMADPDGPASLGLAGIVDPGAGQAAVDGAAQRQERWRRASRDAQDGRQGRHRPGACIDHGRGVPARQMLLGELPVQGLGMAGREPPAHQHDRAAGQFGAQRN